MRIRENLHYGKRLAKLTARISCGVRSLAGARVFGNCFILMLVFYVGTLTGFLGCIDAPSSVAPPASQSTVSGMTDPSEIGMKWWIDGATWFGCTDKETFEKLVELAHQDPDAFESAMSLGVRDGTVARLQHGEQVYVIDATFAGVVRLLRKRDAVEY